MSPKPESPVAAVPRAPAAAVDAPRGLRLRLAGAREVLAFAVHTARQSRLMQVAASLTFSSVLAIVPLLAVVLAVFTAFPLFAEMRESLEQNLAKSLLPVPYAQTILRYLADFAAKAAGVGAAGLALLGVTALSMILTVDRILNDIWQVHQRRPLARRLLVYWALLSLGPVVLAISLSLSSYVVSLSLTPMARWGSGIRPLLQFVPPLIAAAAYSTVYALVPNRTVAWSHAITGGVVTAAADELLSRGFAAYVMHGSFLNIYGAFAAIPIFLIWIYLSWLSFLFGAAIAATLPQLRHTRFADSQRAGDRAITALAAVKFLFDARRDGTLRAYSTHDLARTLRIYDQDLAAILTDLENLGYVRRLAASETSPEQWLLACDPQTVGLGPLFHRFVLDPQNSLLLRQDLDLAPWIAPAVSGEWLSRGLSCIVPEPEPEPEPKAEAAATASRMAIAATPGR
jgi:membrane protein